VSWKIRFEIEISGVEDMLKANDIGNKMKLSLNEYLNVFLRDFNISGKNIIIKNSKEIER
jgi:hypothetical protein